MIFGVSFNASHARYLGVDPKTVLNTVLTQWGFRYLRLSAQWNTLESEPGKYNFGDLDWQMDMAAEQGAKVILAVGQKTPRWPECHLPDWAKKLNESDYRAALENFTRHVINRYKSHKALEIWQVENEAFLPFGECRAFTRNNLADEIKLVRSLDSAHQTLTVDSGELSTWRKTAKVADLFGTTMYRTVWNKTTGYFSYDWLPALFYRAKLWLNGRDVNETFIMELQAEPWIPNNNPNTTDMAEQYKSMSLKRLEKNVNFARRVGLPRAYLWGAEWWYWLKIKGENAIPDFIANLSK